MSAGFDREVYALVRRIPRGRTVTYGEVAAMLGRPRAARAVGGAMRRCPGDVPWHRVLNAAGRISRRRRAASMLTQRMLLEREGVTMRRGRVDLARHAWDAAAGVRRPRRPVTRPARAGRLRLQVDDERAWNATSSGARQRRGRAKPGSPRRPREREHEARDPSQLLRVEGCDRHGPRAGG